MIELSHVSKRFRDVLALHDISLSIPGGRIALLGPNGSGKSTLIKIILGLIPPDTGTCRVLGFDVLEQGTDIRSHIGYMPEHDCLPTDLNAVEFVSAMGRLSGMGKIKAMERTHEVLYYLNMRDERYRPLGSYSGGMKQKVKLAQAIVHDPDIVFMDEPTSGLDPISRNEMLMALKTMAEHGHTNYILSTHLLQDVNAICDRVVMLHGGQLVVEDSLDNLLGKHRMGITVRTFGDPARLGEILACHNLEVSRTGEEIEVEWNHPDDMTRIIRLMAHHGFPLRQINTRVRDLDDVYLDIVERRRSCPHGRGEATTIRDRPVTDRDRPVTVRNGPVTDRDRPVTDRNGPVTDRDRPVTDRNGPGTRTRVYPGTTDTEGERVRGMESQGTGSGEENVHVCLDSGETGTESASRNGHGTMDRHDPGGEGSHA